MREHEFDLAYPVPRYLKCDLYENFHAMIDAAIKKYTKYDSAEKEERVGIIRAWEAKHKWRKQ